MKFRNCTLSSKQIRKAIEDGMIVGENIKEENIQPSSFEPTIGNELFVVDSEYQGMFRMTQDDSVYDNLCRLPQRQRKLVDITNGYELKKGFSYLIPLNEKLQLPKDIFIKSSPKSSLGRLFLNTRLMADNNPGYDEITSAYGLEKVMSLWLFVQPLAFNVIVYPGLALNQIRFFSGHDSLLNPSELIRLVKKRPVLYIQDFDGNRIPAETVITDGLTIHLNLSGRTTHDIVGLRARHNPEPIDLSKKAFYEIEDYFEPIVRQDRIFIKRGEYYLLSSKEILDIPEDINTEVRDFSRIGFLGPLHYAGFIDNGFVGALVFEIRSDELSKEVELVNNMPVSKLDLYRTYRPDKLYGDSSNNYQYQIGPKPAKYFKSIDYKYLSRQYSVLNQEVLVIDKSILLKKVGNKRGFTSRTREGDLSLDILAKNGDFLSRYNCETDDLALQCILYVILRFKNGEYFVYQKNNNIDYYPENRLFDKYSIGLGAHIIKDDSPNYIENSFKRTLSERGLSIEYEKFKPKFKGYIYTDNAPVDRYHFGLVYELEIDSIDVKEEGFIKEWEIVKKSDLKRYIKGKDYESWSESILHYFMQK
jgi:dCTP deaminase